jgi:hypothetical protein
MVDGQLLAEAQVVGSAAEWVNEPCLSLSARETYREEVRLNNAIACIGRLI